ncbi:MAG: LuxR C-terminal-related transcriptional regulator [Bacteroidales bacterium]
MTTIRSQKPDVVLLDIAMPVMDGVEAASQALSLYPDLKIITLSMYGDENYYNLMIEAGVKGFILKDSEIDEVEKAIITVNAARTYFSQELLQSMLEGLKKEDSVVKIALSEREVEVLQYVCRGKTNIEIADQMCLSKRTVEKHRANIMEKHAVKTQPALLFLL